MEKFELQPNPEKIALTTRNFQLQMDLIGLSPDSLAGKRVVNVGSGLSDFMILANEYQGTECIGIDPIYQTLRNSKTFEEFSSLVKMFGVTTKDVIAGGDNRPTIESMWDRLKVEIEQHPERYIGQKSDEAELPRESVDNIIMCNFFDNLGDEKIARETLKRSFEWLKKDGQINIYPFKTSVFQSGETSGVWRASLDAEFFGGSIDQSRIKKNIGGNSNIASINKNDTGYYLTLIQEISKMGGVLYLYIDSKKPNYEDEVVTHSILIIRKDSSAPVVEKRSWAQGLPDRFPIKIDPKSVEIRNEIVRFQGNTVSENLE